MKKLSAVILALLIATILTSYFPTTLSSNDVVTWIKYSGNPLGLGLDRVVEPWVIYDGLMFKMWYTGIIDHHGIYYATSPDGVNWIPHGIVLDIGESGSWEGLAVGRPVVLFDGIIYKMWYMGHDGFAHRIGYATSMDGINWIKYEANPVLVPGGNGGWDDGGLGEFTVTFDGILYRMWYNGQAFMHAALKIGVATSPDGISWTKYAHNPVLVPGPSAWDNKHIYSGPVVNVEGSYEMWYPGQSYADNVRIGLATSPDGLIWTKGVSNPVLDIGPAGSWDSAFIYASSVVKKDNRLLMWYWGGPDPSGLNVQIGLATSYAMAGIDIDPDALNLMSNGEWVTAYTSLPEGYLVENIDVTTVEMRHDDFILAAEWADVQDGVLMVKFDRIVLRDYFGAADLDDGDKFYDVTLTVTGELVDGTLFEGSDTIAVIKK